MYLARVKAGHDRNQYYVVQSQDEKFVYLVNGTTRTCDRPRKKSYKHVQLVKKQREAGEVYLKNSSIL